MGAVRGSHLAVDPGELPDVALHHDPVLLRSQSEEARVVPSVEGTFLETAEGLPGLEHLNLWDTSVTDEGVVHLPSFPSLTWLNLDNTALTDEGMPYVGQLENLEFAHLGSTNISDEGLEHLHGLENLRHLVVTFCPGVTAAGVRDLREAVPSLERVEH
jgi:hypothetical protein